KICAGPAQSLDDSCSNRIADSSENDGYSRCCSLHRLGGRRSETRDDHIRIGLDQIGCDLRQAIRLSFGGAEVENQILAFAVAEFSKPLLYNRRVLTGEQSEVSHAIRLCRLLRARGARPGGCGTAEKRNELAPFHGSPPGTTRYHIV